MSRILPSNSEHELAKSLDKLQADPLYLIHVIHSSGHSISLIKSLSDLGFDFSPFNKCPKSGDTICALVSKNIGLAIKTLIRAGVDLTAKDSKNDDSPLLLLAAEGLCGPVSSLIASLPRSHLNHVNKHGITASSLLLIRGHGECGCLRMLLSKVPLVTALPARISNSHAGFARLAESVSNCDIAAPSERHVLLLSIRDLLDHIKTSSLKRLFAVVELWVAANLLVPPSSKDEVEGNSSTVISKLLRPMCEFFISRSNTSEAAIFIKHRSFIDIFIHLISRLAIVGQLCAFSNMFVDFVAEQIRLSENDSQALDTLCKYLDLLRNLFAPPLPLCLLAIRNLRKHLQTCLVMRSINEDLDMNDIESSISALGFIDQIDRLPVDPTLKRIVRLEVDYRLPMSIIHP